MSKTFYVVVLVCAAAAVLAALIFGRRQTAGRPALKKLLVCSMLTAMGAVLGGALSIPAFFFGEYSVKIGFGVLPVIISAVLYGPKWGALVGMACDLTQALMFPKGPYMPWFTLSGALFGLLPGLFFMKGQPRTKLRLSLAILCGQIAGSVIVNTALNIWLYGMTVQIIIPRLINQAVMIPLFIVLTYGLLQGLKRSGALSEELHSVP